MQQYLSHFTAGWQSFIAQVAHPGWGNFFWLLIIVSFSVFILELIRPWRRAQPVLRPELAQDIFYMFFNMFLFPLIGYATVSTVLAGEFEKISLVQSLRGFIPLHKLAPGLQILILFLLRDFLQWNIHVVLHRVPFLWKLHEVHHSSETMSFPVHLRYHWAENIIYRVPEYVVFLLIGSNVSDVFIIYVVSLTIGHLNHANVKLPWGFLKYIFNTSELHMWHHAKNPPNRFGVNFAISLSLWDWVFRTAYNPPRQPEAIGLTDETRFPKSFLRQLFWPWGSAKNTNTGGSAL